WPPSKPALILPLPERAKEPLWPRPAVLPRPEPMPRPTRLRSARAPSAGESVFMRMSYSSTRTRQWTLLISPRTCGLSLSSRTSFRSEAGLDLALARAREGALVAAAGGLAQAGTDAATDALALGARALGGRKCIHAHVLFLHTDEVVDLVDQSTDLRAVLEFPDIVQFVQAQRLDRQAMLRLRAAQALDQAHLDGAAVGFVLSHAAGPPPSCRAWPRCGPANASPSAPSAWRAPG